MARTSLLHPQESLTGYIKKQGEWRRMKDAGTSQFPVITVPSRRRSMASGVQRYEQTVRNRKTLWRSVVDCSPLWHFIP
jgi:hypothetical protein